MRLFLAPLLVLFCVASALAQGDPKLFATIDPTTLRAGQSATITLIAEVPFRYHAQSHTPLSKLQIPFVVGLKPIDGINPGEPVYPEGKIKPYRGVGDMSVYDGKQTITLPLTIDKNAITRDAKLQVDVRYQMCDDRGVCFAPKTVTVDVPARIEGVAGTVPATQSSDGSASSGTTISLFGFSMNIDGIATAIPVGIVVGILFNLMPCVLPVLPLKAIGFFEASQHDRKRSLALGTAFSIGLIAVFVALAMFVLGSRSLVGQHVQWGKWFAYAPFVWGMGILLIVLGVGMLGAFAIRIPNALYGLNFRHDTLGGNFRWGILTALLSTPCTAPMFAGLITWSITQPLASGAAVMLSVGVGMALPYFILSAFPELARKFPRTGPASELIKQAMAFPPLGTAAWLIGPSVVEDPAHWWLVVAVMVWGAMFVMIRASQILKSSAGILVTTALAVLVVGTVTSVAVRFSGEVPWEQYSDKTLADARASGRPVIVKFTASWCANCQVIEAAVYHDSTTLAELRNRDVVLIKANLKEDDAPGWKKLNELGYTGIPLTAIYLPGSEKPVLLDSMYTSSGLLDLIK